MLSSADLLHAADRLEVDVVVFAGREGGVPVAEVRLVVSHGERQRFWEVPGRQLRSEVVRQARAGGVLIGHGLAVTLPAAGVPSGSVRVDLLHHDLIRAVDDRHNITDNQHIYSELNIPQLSPFIWILMTQPKAPTKYNGFCFEMIFWDIHTHLIHSAVSVFFLTADWRNLLNHSGFYGSFYTDVPFTKVTMFNLIKHTIPYCICKLLRSINDEHDQDFASPAVLLSLIDSLECFIQ